MNRNFTLFFFLFIPLFAFAQTNDRAAFQAFYAELQAYRDSLQQINLELVSPALAGFDCQECKLMWIQDLNSLNPAKPARNRSACRWLKRFGRDQRRTRRAKDQYGKATYTFQFIGNRYLIVNQELILGSIRGKYYYFDCRPGVDFPLPPASVDVSLLREYGPQPPLGNCLEELRDTQSDEYLALQKLWRDLLQSPNREVLNPEVPGPWKLRFYYEFAWESVIGSYEASQTGIFRPTCNILQSTEGLWLDIPIQNDLLTQEEMGALFGGLPSRDAAWQNKWLAWVIDDRYLLVRYVSSYPDGNMTSWHKEMAYVLERWK